MKLEWGDQSWSICSHPSDAVEVADVKRVERPADVVNSSIKAQECALSVHAHGIAFAGPLAEWNLGVNQRL